MSLNSRPRVHYYSGLKARAILLSVFLLAVLLSSLFVTLKYFDALVQDIHAAFENTQVKRESISTINTQLVHLQSELYRLLNLSLHGLDAQQLKTQSHAVISQLEDIQLTMQSLPEINYLTAAETKSLQQTAGSLAVYIKAVRKTLQAIASGLPMTNLYMVGAEKDFEKLLLDLDALLIRATEFNFNTVLEAATESEGLIMLSFITVAFIVLIVVTYAFSQLTRAITEITTSMTQIVAGPVYSQVPYLSRKDEIGKMARTLNVFRDNALALQQSNLELEKYQNQLEEMVEQRTQEVKETTTRLKHAQRLVHMGTWERDFTRDVAYWSEEVFEILARPAQQVASFEQALEYIHPDDKQHVIARLEDSMLPGKTCEVEYRIVRPNGDIRHIFSLGQVTKWTGKQPVKMVGALLDITDRKNAAIDLAKAKEQAEKANIEKSRFLSNMSHELRTPMHAIHSFTNLALKREQDSKIRHFLENIQVSTTRLTELLNDLLDLSKLESGKLTLNPKKHDLSKLVKNTISSLESLLQAGKLKVDTTGLQAVTAAMDNKLMTQVITNLFSNAIKFSQAGMSICVTTQEILENNKSYIQFSIKDQGIGIPADELESVFDAFVQSSKTASTAGGTGLGLPISREIIELHHGKIWARSPVNDQGGGVEFSFAIPRDYFQHDSPDIDQFIQSHQEWKLMIEAIIHGRGTSSTIPTDLIQDEALCELGKWLNEASTQQYFTQRDYLEITRQHKKFHQLAAQLMDRQKQQDYSTVYNQFNQASLNIVKLIKRVS